MVRRLNCFILLLYNALDSPVHNLQIRQKADGFRAEGIRMFIPTFVYPRLGASNPTVENCCLFGRCLKLKNGQSPNVHLSKGTLPLGRLQKA